MNKLSKSLLVGLLEQENYITAFFGGGFKPPTKGHFEVVKQSLEQNPDIDKLYVVVGSGIRDGVSQDESYSIWNIYKKYLGDKVEVVKADSSPLKYIKDYIKTNTEHKSIILIGSREGNDEDANDLQKRKTFFEKYGNHVVVKDVITAGGISGTKAREAAKISKEQFFQYLPTQLTDEEKNLIFSYIQSVIQEKSHLDEDISKSQLDDVESYADKLFAKLGIDVEFTRHFLDRLNDKRNGKPISVAELMGIFKRLHRKHGKPLSKTDFDFEAVVKDLRNDLNIPFAINITPEDIDLVAKTIMRKKDFKTSTPVIAINENASYSKDIDYKKHILELTKHMLDKGMNIKPLPKVIFNDGDVENAREFLGRTAYYNPNNNTIVLYTEGRHPKDIVRSFAHEMIHHIQNLEGRLENISTTNTHEDDHLNDIEAEANLKGTMTFRNWTDTLTTSVSENNPEDGKAAPYGSGYNKLNEVKPYKHKHGFDDKLGKDPFGLNQFAREIAEETINEGRYDSCANKVTKIVFEKFKSFHDEGPNDGEFEQSVGSECADIIDDTFEFDLIGKVKFTDGEYSLDGGSNAGFDNFGEEITPLLVVKFKIPTNPDWQKIYFDIADVVRHELEHLTQDGENVKPGKKMNDDKFIRDLINADLLPKSQYFKLEKEVDAMLQGLYFKAKKSKQPLKKVIDEYLDIFVTKNEITSEDKEEILDIWRSRGKALSLPLFENKTMSEAENTNYVIYCDMDGVLVDFDKQFTKLSDGIAPRDYENQNGKDEFWNLIDNVGGVGFWVGMPWMPNGKQLWEYISPNTPTLLSSPSRSEKSRLGKRLWVRNNLPGTKLILANSYNKKNYAEENHILIDDRPSNIDQWRAAGGIGILFTSTNQTIQELKELGL